MSERPDNPPAFLFYPGDALSSRALAMMTSEEVGGWFWLRCHAWKDADPEVGVLPDDDAALAKLSRLGDRWPECAPAIRRAFAARVRHGVPVLVDEVLVRERQAQLARKGPARKGAQITNARRWGSVAGRSSGDSLFDPPAIAEESPDGRLSSSSSSSSSREEDARPGPSGVVPLSGTLARVVSLIGLPHPGDGAGDAEAGPGTAPEAPPGSGQGVPDVRAILGDSGWTGHPSVRVAAQLGNRLAKAGVSEPVLRMVLRHFRDRVDRVKQPFAYYHPTAPGFASLREALSAELSMAEGEDFKRLERAFLGGAR